jgi:hypothetical protein
MIPIGSDNAAACLEAQAANARVSMTEAVMAAASPRRELSKPLKHQRS